MQDIVIDNSNSNGRKIIKFNVNFILDEDSIKRIKSFNKKVCELVGSEINFEKLEIPHITLLKYAISPRDAKIVNSIVFDNLQNLSFKDFQIEKVDVKGNYILADVENCEEILKIGGEIENKIKQYIVEPPTHPMSIKNKPHLTLGWTKECEKAQNLFDNKSFPLRVRPMGIRISVKYDHGTIRDALKTIPLKEKDVKNDKEEK